MYSKVPVVFALCALAVYVRAQPMEEMLKFKDECLSESNLSQDQFDKLIKGDMDLAKSDEFKCFTGCIWKNANLLNDDFTLNEATAEELVKKLPEEKMKKMSSVAIEKIKSELQGVKSKCEAGAKICEIGKSFIPK